MEPVSEVKVARLIKRWKVWRRAALDDAATHHAAADYQAARRFDTVANTYLCCINALEEAAGVPLADQTL